MFETDEVRIMTQHEIEFNWKQIAKTEASY